MPYREWDGLTRVPAPDGDVTFMAADEGEIEVPVWWLRRLLPLLDDLEDHYNASGYPQFARHAEEMMQQIAQWVPEER